MDVPPGQHNGFAKYVCKKLPEMCDNKSGSTLNTAELMPNMCDNHHPYSIM
jgi:hypothetical protein